MEMTDYQRYIHASRYARWLPEEGRRETWKETVERYIDYFDDRMGSEWTLEEMAELQRAILNLEIMPSMRALLTSGVALDRDNVAGYNCSYVAVDHVRSFDETMYILMCGTGVGFSVERQYVSKLPEVAETLHETDSVIVVADSKIGWASSFRELISLLYSGKVPQWDVSRVRAAGEPLKTFGGRASGPGPLVDLFKFSVSLFKGAAGRKLTSYECHSLMCKIAEVVVVGGVRRSACISLSNLTDERMRNAKTGQWWVEHPEFGLANNSVCYTEKPDMQIFLREWNALYESKCGERGIFNRVAARNQASKSGRRDTDYEFGTNPCSEIILRPNQFCNLSEVVVRHNDTLDDLKRKVRLATILGTLQATLTDFRYLRKVWSQNTAEEALLGVSLTGMMDHPVLSGNKDGMENWLEQMQAVAVDVNKEWSSKLGINQATAITCTKPSGTVSQLVDSASGIHPRHNPYYIRRVRNDVKDPLSEFLIDQGVPYEVDQVNPSTYVFSFPQKAPDGAVCRTEVGAMGQLKHWMKVQDHWCEHKPSITVYYKDDEFLEVGAYVYKNFDKISGVSFLPHSDHTYPQAPYEDITEDQYNELAAKQPVIDWSKFPKYERAEDTTTGSQELACTAGGCEI